MNILFFCACREIGLDTPLRKCLNVMLNTLYIFPKKQTCSTLYLTIYLIGIAGNQGWTECIYTRFRKNVKLN